MTNRERRQLLDRFRASGMEGSILDVYQAYGQGRDLIAEHYEQQQQQEPVVLTTPQEQQQGLRPYHAAGDMNRSAVFKDVPPHTPFNTHGMSRPINIEKYDEQGHLVESHKSIPPGISNIPTGPHRGDVIETPAEGYRDGGFLQNGGTVKRGRKKHARSIRQYAHHVEGEPAGSKSTHLMATFEEDGKYYAAPTITTNKEGYRDQSFDEALAAGEVYEFKNPRRADKFAHGSWKKGKDRREAMRDYRRGRKMQGGGEKKDDRTTRGQERVQAMLDSGNWKLGPNGELLRVSAEESNKARLEKARTQAMEELAEENPAKYKPTTVGFPTPERIEYLNSKEELTESEIKELNLQAFDPSHPMNVAFSLLTPAGPVEALATKLVSGAVTTGAKVLPRLVPSQKLLDEYVKTGRYMLDQLKGTNAGSKIATGVADQAINVKHGTTVGDLTADQIKFLEAYKSRGDAIRRPKHSQNRTGLDQTAGFYTARGNEGALMGTDNMQHQIGLTIPQGSRFIDLSKTGFNTDAMSVGDLQKMYQDGYDYIVGRNMSNREEIIPLNPEILKSFRYNYLKGGVRRRRRKRK